MKLCNTLENMTLRLLLTAFVAISFAVFGQDTGFVAGTAVDGRSGLPLEGVTRTLNGKSITTDYTRKFELEKPGEFVGKQVTLKKGAKIAGRGGFDRLFSATTLWERRKRVHRLRVPRAGSYYWWDY